MRNNATNMHPHSQRRGFTLVELSLALVFLSILLTTIAMLTIHISTTYQKGVAIQAISSTGRELIDDFTRSISAASSFDPGTLCASKYDPKNQEAAYNNCKADGGALLIANQRTVSNIPIKENNKTVSNAPVSGTFCTGRYSYIYNTGYTLDGNTYGFSGRRATYQNNSNTQYNGDTFHLLKVSDPGRSVCSQGLSPNSYSVNSATAPTYSTNDTVEELLDSTENDLALYDLKVFAPSRNTLTMQAFYSGTFILATVRGGVNIKGTGDYCTSPPEDSLATDFAYCAINKFNFATRATGGTS